MSRRLAVLALIVLVGATFATVFYLRRDDDPRTVAVRRGTLDISIETVGTIMAAREQVLRAGVPGVIATVAARPGDQVEASDIVMLLARNTIDEQIHQAERAVVDAEFALQIAEQDVDDAASAGPATAEVLAAQRQLEEAQAALAAAQEALQHSAILATESGIVLEILAMEGEPVTAGQPLARIYRPEDLHLVARVDELGLPSVAPGAPATFRLDAFPERSIEGSVTRSAPVAEQEAGVAFFPTQIDFDVPSGVDIRPGMNAEVSITTESRQGVLLIPESVIQAIGERAFVRVLDDGEEREIEIVLGRRGEGMVEVVEGLQEGDLVIVP